MLQVFEMVKYNLDGKVVIITGASVGLGEQFAHAFAESGAHVVLAARREELLKKLAEGVSSKYGVKAIAMMWPKKRISSILSTPPLRSWVR